MGQEHSNRLALEVSPYLLQHARNPVDWFPWGEEAFAAAREEDKPIFLSIGYATCHWCHVMEKECFDDPEIAQMMNETFVNVKVDREEHPEVDSLYMDCAHAILGGGGGWPLNLVLTPDLRPVFAATYLPVETTGDHLGMRQLIERIDSLWKSELRGEVFAQAERVLQEVEWQQERELGDLPSKEMLSEIISLTLQMADPLNGGMQGAPKFPMGYQLSYLLTYANLHQESRVLFFVQKSLEMMYRGGIHDHLGGGFSRYTVDDQWLIPHFEKMLYDNALLMRGYWQAWLLTRNPLYEAVSNSISTYLLGELRHPDGAFLSAEDADSEGEEGKFYTWTIGEIEEVLGLERTGVFVAFYGLTDEGNFDGRNVLHIAQPLEEFAREHAIDPFELGEELTECRKALFAAREKRPRPLKDDKILTSWNGLVIRTLAESRHIDEAEAAASFLRKELWKGERLLHRWRNGKVGLAGGLEDYAFLISGLLSLFNVTGKEEWLQWALDMTDLLAAEFRSPDGGFYRTDGRDPNLLLRQVDLFDGAEPSGNGVHCENLLRLHQIFAAPEYLEQAEGILRVVTPFLYNHPLAGAYHTTSVQRYLDTKRLTLVIALNEEREWEEEIKQALSERFLSHTEVVWATPEHQGPIGGKTTLHPCSQGACKAPLNEKNLILSFISNL